jgi:hypothetical protein
MTIVINSNTLLIDFLKDQCTMIETSDGPCYYSPYWFNEKWGKLQLFDFDNIPNELVDEIKKRREK